MECSEAFKELMDAMDTKKKITRLGNSLTVVAFILKIYFYVCMLSPLPHPCV